MLTVEGWWWTEIQIICRRVKVVRFRGVGGVNVVVEINKLRLQLRLLGLSNSGLLNNTQLAVWRGCGLMIDVCVLSFSKAKELAMSSAGLLPWCDGRYRRRVRRVRAVGHLVDKR